MSGIEVAPECVTEWNLMKLKHMYNYLIFVVKDQKQIVVDVKGKGPYTEFKSNLSNSACRYAAVEVPGTTKIVFILWAPDNAPVKDRMIYASSRQAILDKLSGHTRAIQASDLSELDEAKVKSYL
eukprot:Protomagalhaensia_wolfi_Nauph_80__5790@NODE_715_length_2077_cov_1389_038763_g492_i1_p2_GENE_NODE_715_length_2077_cov_1389_038763_g492_i1NODE_715_length_2077_cov_1389_038763_g492_i1_p2_ORF_typecomplete_len125_score23_04Cofilin_ADF/PF00241_20/1_2e27_NODE_715_length_2077_cov_1389_038763_g492_i1194568